jgi:hypothetical protein
MNIISILKNLAQLRIITEMDIKERGMKMQLKNHHIKNIDLDSDYDREALSPRLTKAPALRKSKTIKEDELKIDENLENTINTVYTMNTSNLNLYP